MSAEFPKFQISLPREVGMFTVRADTFEEFTESLIRVGDQDVAESVLARIRAGLEALADGDVQSTLAAGGIKTTRLEDKLCPGHKVAMTLKDGKRGKFWSCNGKTASGDWAWKAGEGCKAEDFEPGDEKYNPNTR